MRSLDRNPPSRREGGYSLVEVLVAAVILVIVFLGLAQLYTRGRTQVDYEEDRRRATALAQARLDGIRRDDTFVTIPGLNGKTTHYKVDGRTYTVVHKVKQRLRNDAGSPDTLQLDTLKLTVSWSAKTYSGSVTRSLETSTLLGRGMP